MLPPLRLVIPFILLILQQILHMAQGLLYPW